MDLILTENITVTLVIDTDYIIYNKPSKTFFIQIVQFTPSKMTF